MSGASRRPTLGWRCCPGGKLSAAAGRVGRLMLRLAVLPLALHNSGCCYLSFNPWAHRLGLAGGSRSKGDARESRRANPIRPPYKARPTPCRHLMLLSSPLPCRDFDPSGLEFQAWISFGGLIRLIATLAGLRKHGQAVM